MIFIFKLFFLALVALIYVAFGLNGILWTIGGIFIFFWLLD
jgi:hypothetical protein